MLVRNKSQFISLYGMPLPPFFLVNTGWVEKDHSAILKMKEHIEEFSNTEEWEIRKKITNPFEAIYTKDSNFPSIANVNPLSRSYFKMVEMMNLCEFWKQHPLTQTLNSAHVCEGPGGFIQFFVEETKQRGYKIDSVSAMTLRSTKSHIPGWRKSIPFLKQHPEIHLEYGPDTTGNILIKENQDAFIKKGPVHLFTADGGFDFSIDYSKQEQQAFPLVLASFCIGLKMLAKEGTMIIKLFDIYSPATQDLILGSASFFTQFTIYKPDTSRPCNSERYFIGKGFQPSEQCQKWVQYLEKVDSKLITRLFLHPWPKKLKDLLNEQIHIQEQLQVKSIYNTLNLEKKDIYDYINTNIQTSKDWCKRNSIATLY